MASDKAWDGSAANYSDAQAYCKSCLVNENTGDPKDWIKDKCHLPVYESGGALNTNALSAAAAALNGARGGVKISPAAKAAAAKKLRGLYQQAKMPIPDGLKNM